MDKNPDEISAVEVKNDAVNKNNETFIDELLEESRLFGRHNILIHLSSYYLFLVVIYNFMLSFFTGIDPPWRCLHKNSSNFCQQHYNESISRESDVFKERCYLNRTEWAHTTEKTYSFVTEFDLICDKTALAALISGSYYIGGVIGAAVSGTISDAYGRQPVITISILLTTCSAIGCSYIRNIWQLFALNILRGTGNTACYYVTLIYISEFAAPSYRLISTNILLIFSTFSLLLFDGLAYFVRSWRHVSAYAAWPSIPIFIVFCFLPESPRWLLTRGRNIDAEIVMGKVCTFNNRTRRVIHLKSPNSVGDTKYTYIDLIRNWKILKLTLSTLCVWLVLPVLYYSISMQSSSFGGNMYEAYALSTIADIPGCLFSSYLSNKVGRKKSILGGCFLSGIFMGSLAFVPPSLPYKYTINVTIACIARFVCCISFYGMYTWSMELFPTILRSQGLGLCAISDRLGMFLVPFVTRLCENVTYTLPFIILCVAATFASIVGLCLPETLNKPTRETYEDFFENTSANCGNDGVEGRPIECKSGVDNGVVQLEDEMV